MRTPREHECGDPFDSRQNDRHVRPSSRSACPFPRPQFRSSLIFGPPTTDSAVPSGIPACDCPYFSVTRTGPPTANWREVLRDHLVLAPHQLSDLPCQVDRRTSPPPATVSVTRHHYLGAMEPVTDPVRSRVSNSSASVAERVSTTSDRTVSVASQNTATTVVGVGSNTPRGEWNPKLGEAG